MNKDLNKSTKMTNEFDLWGSVNHTSGDFLGTTSMVEENCLGRARDMFEWCENNQEAQSITATFISNDGPSQSSIAGPPEGTIIHNLLFYLTVFASYMWSDTNTLRKLLSSKW